MFKYVVSGLLFFYSLASCSQTMFSIKKINAFFVEKMPGNIPVDENGKSLFKGPDTLITVYAEISGKEPEWKTAWRNGKTYTVSASLVSQTPYEAGTRESDGKKVMLTPASGNKLWRLTLMESNIEIKLPQKLKPGELILLGKSGSKFIYKKIPSLVQLTTLPSV
jgi:hypothetical protein